MMPDLMRHDIGSGKIPRRAKLAQQSAHEIQIYVNALIGRAVKGPHLCLSSATARPRRPAIEDQHRFFVATADCLEGLIPYLFGFRQDAGDEAPRLIFREPSLARSLLPLLGGTRHRG